MELLQLRYFQTVAETQNITKAAKKLFITQPALSASIARLEKDIGIALFTRASNRITLTEAGRCFLEYVNSTFSMIEEGVAQAKQIADRDSHQFRVASAFGIVRDLTTAYCGEHPEYEIKLAICDTDEIRQQLIKNEADIGLTLGPVADIRFSNRVLMESRFFIAANKDSPIAGQGSVTLKELEDHLLFCSNIAQTYERIQEMFRRVGCRCKLLTLDEKDVLFMAARKGLGHVICMPMRLSNRQTVRGEEDLVFIPIRDCAERGQVVMVSRKDAYFPSEAEQYISFLAKCFRSIEQRTRKALEDQDIDPDG